MIHIMIEPFHVLYYYHLKRRVHLQVYRAVAACVAARDARGAGGAGGGLSADERRALWGCCRFAYCSAAVQARPLDRALTAV